MNSSSLARSAGSSFDNPEASYCSGVIAFCTPGKAGFSGSAADSGPREARRRQRTMEIFFIYASLLLDLFRGPMSKAKRFRDAILEIRNKLESSKWRNDQ